MQQIELLFELKAIAIRGDINKTEFSNE